MSASTESSRSLALRRGLSQRPPQSAWRWPATRFLGRLRRPARRRPVQPLSLSSHFLSSFTAESGHSPGGKLGFIVVLPFILIVRPVCSSSPTAAFSPLHSFATMSDDMRSSTTTSNKGRKPARPRILVVSNPSPYPDLSSDSEEAKHAQNIPRPYRTLPHPPSPHPPPPPPTGRQPLSFSGIPPPPPLTADEQEPKQGYHSASSNPALSSPSSTSSPAVESTPPPSTPGQSAPPVDLSGEGTLRPEMFALSSADRNEAVCQRSAQIIDASKSSFSRRPHIRRTSQNSRPSSVSGSTYVLGSRN